MRNKISRKFPAHESGAGGSVAYFLAKADFFLTNADLQEGALGHALLCIQCLISRDLCAKQWPATKHWLQGQIIAAAREVRSSAGRRTMEKMVAVIVQLLWFVFPWVFLLVFLILQWQGLMISRIMDREENDEEGWKRGKFVCFVSI